MKTYSTSQKKIWILFFIFAFGLGLVWAFGGKYRSGFDIEGFLLGYFGGSLFGALVLFYGLGQKIFVSEREISLSSNMFTLIFPRFRQRLLINNVESITISATRYNKGKSFISININGPQNMKGLTFNPDLFDEAVLRTLFKDLPHLNPAIQVSKNVERFISGESGNKVFLDKALRNFGKWAVYLILGALITIGIYLLFRK